MDQRPNPDYRQDIEDALDWWREAGVDLDFVDEPTGWFAAPQTPGDRPMERRQITLAPIDSQVPTGYLDPADLPQDLTAFAHWWLTDPKLDAGDPSRRVPARGPAGASLMVVVEEPEAQDGETLLSGPQGRLLDAILAAFGTQRGEVYLASALPRHMPAADWQRLREQGMGKALAHHIFLAQPQRLFILGGNVLSLIGHEPPQRPAVLRSFNHEGRSIPLLASWALPALLGQPRAKPVLWRTWLDWISA